jgi:2-oxoisovalerate dehydrogenase E1 component beta subunit
LPSVATSQLLRTTREAALRAPGIKWAEEDESGAVRNIVGGRETRKMNLYQAVRDALRCDFLALTCYVVVSDPVSSIAMIKDDNAFVFGEDVAFGGVFRCTMVCPVLATSLTGPLFVGMRRIGTCGRIW